MEKIDITDSNGAVFPMKKYGGKLFPNVVPDDIMGHLENLNTLPFTADDALVVSYLKSGTHWVYEIANMIVKKKAEYHKMRVPILDYYTPERMKQYLDGEEGRRVVTTHFQPQFIPEKIIQQKVKMIFVYRNPKDVAVSYFNFFRKLKPYSSYKNGEWKNFFALYLNGTVPCGYWPEFIRDWLEFQTKNPDYPFLVLCYEDMKNNLEGEVKKLMEFLGEAFNDGTATEIARLCKFQNMVVDKTVNRPQELDTFTDCKEHIFYRKGEVGDWKNWFTVAQNEEFYRVMGPSIKELNVDVKYTL